MFGFGKKNEKRSIQQQVSWVPTSTWDNFITSPGYTRLADNPDVISAVNTIADLVSNMSIHLLENTEQGNKRVENELSRLIDVSPQKGMTRKAWITKIVRDLYLFGDGNAIAKIVVQPGADYLSELRLLDMSQVSYLFDDDKNTLKIRYGNQELDSSSIVHFIINPNERYPRIGTGFEKPLRTILDNLAQATATKSQFMRGKYMPNIIIKVDSDSEELSSEEGRQKIREKYLASENDRLAPWVIPAEMMEVQQVKPLTLKDIAINESVELDKKTVAGMFGVPAFLLGVGKFDKDEYNNFINTRIAGLGQVIAQTLTRDVLFKKEWYFQFNPRSLYQYDISELVNAGKEMVDRTAMGRNEWRGWVGLPPRSDMEELITLENYIPTEKLGDQSKLKGGDTDENDGETNPSNTES